MKFIMRTKYATHYCIMFNGAAFVVERIIENIKKGLKSVSAEKNGVT